MKTKPLQSQAPQMSEAKLKTLEGIKLNNGMNAGQALMRMNGALIKSLFNAVVDAADAKGWGGLNNINDVVGDGADDGGVVEAVDLMDEEFEEHLHEVDS